MISLSISELGCPSLEYVYAMTWAEYMIRLHAFKRRAELEAFRHRDLCWFSLVGPHQNPKKLPKRINQFMPLGDDLDKESKTTDLMRKRMEQVKNEYLEQQKLKKNGRRE